MQLSTLLLPLLAAATAAQYYVESPPVQLVVLSPNATINGSLLLACHEGAGIEGLCLNTYFTPPLAPSTFNFNTSTYNITYNATYGEPGHLTWLLRGGNFNVSSALQFTYRPASNVAHPQFFPGGDQGVNVAFDPQDRLNLQDYYDSTTFPVTFGDRALYNWVACVSYVQGYTYQTVNWVMGGGKADNPTCQDVIVKRVFV